MASKLLLADDSVTIQRVIELTFADEDVEVLTVGDGRQAIERVQSDHPDIVLADIGMPERDGYEVAAFIKGNPEFAHIPVLLLTGAFEPVDEARARSVGCDGVLVKPFEPQMVISRVRDLLAGGRTAPAVSQPAADHPPVPGGLELDRLEPASAAPAKAEGDSLEDYFDRLDAALANLAPGPPPAPEPGFGDVVHHGQPTVSPAQSVYSGRTGSDEPTAWDPDLAPATSRPPAAPPFPADPVRTAAHPRITEEQVPPNRVPAAPSVRGPGTPLVSQAFEPPAPAGVDAALASMLPEAFAALLAAERGEIPAPPAWRTATQAREPLSDEAIEQIAQRVISRLGGDDMRRAVLDTAERLVREEIERIKRA